MDMSAKIPRKRIKKIKQEISPLTQVVPTEIPTAIEVERFKHTKRVYLRVQELGSNILEVKETLQNLVFKRNEEVEKEIHSKHIHVAFAALFLLVVLGIVVSKKSQAEVAMFYPSSCLGGWTNIAKATGKPDVVEEKSFSNLNSAILPENTQTDLFCGGFTGDVPPNKDPKVLILRIAWSQTGSTSTSEVIEGESFASSTGDILDATTSPDFISTPLATTTEQASTTQEIVPQSTTTPDVPVLLEPVENKTQQEPVVPVESSVTPSTPEIKPVVPVPDTSAPQSRGWLPSLIAFLKVFTPYVYAQEANTSTEPRVTTTSEETVTTTSTIPVLVESLPTSFSTGTQQDIPVDTSVITPHVEPVVDPLISPVDTPDISPDNTLATSTVSYTEDIATVIDATNTEATSTSKYPPFFEIEYTLDGTTWTSLGGIALEELQSTQFEIPIPENATWDDLSKLQIHVKRVSNVDTAPTIFLDGMILEIETQDFTGKRRNQKIMDIVNEVPTIFVKDIMQGDDVSLFIMSSSTHGMALYDASGTLLYTTQTKENENFFSVHDLEYGRYTFVFTDDSNWCAGKTYEECTATSTDAFKGQVTFTVARPVY